MPTKRNTASFIHQSHPATGQWISKDPIGLAAGDPNLYRYVGNNPVKNADPSGQDPKSGTQMELEAKDALAGWRERKGKWTDEEFAYWFVRQRAWVQVLVQKRLMRGRAREFKMRALFTKIMMALRNGNTPMQVEKYLRDSMPRRRARKDLPIAKPRASNTNRVPQTPTNDLAPDVVESDDNPGASGPSTVAARFYRDFEAGHEIVREARRHVARQISELDTSYAAEAVPCPKRSTNTHDDYFDTYWHQKYSGIQDQQGTDAYYEKFGALEKAAIEYADRQMGIQRQQDAQRVTEWQTKEVARKESHDARKKELQSQEDFFASIDATGDTYRAGYSRRLNHQELKGEIIATEAGGAAINMAVDQIDPLDDIRAVGESAQAVIANPKSGREWIIFGIAVVGIFTSFDDSFHAFRRGGRRHKKHHSDGDGGGGGGNPKKRKDGDGPDGGDGVESGKAGAPSRKVTNLTTRTVDEVNAPFVQRGWQAPYGGRNAREFVADQDMRFVRVHGEGNKARSWMMRSHEVEGLSPAQIRDKFALPDLPTHISDVHVPIGTKIRVGKVAPQAGWGIGGGWQYELLERLPESAFRNTRGL